MAVGPVEYLVVTFPDGRFADVIAPVLADAVASQAVRILALAFARRGEDGTLERVEQRVLDPAGLVSFRPPQDETAGLPDITDVDALGRMPEGSSAALIVWEDLWSVPLAQAARTAGGELVAHERVPADGGDDIITLLERLAELRAQGVLTDAEFAAQKARILTD
ncbi:SHOCT domain-containing protein [Streptomyces sp. NBC_01102]|uniref:SHOCT domain-containing protein n=1 Tax=unclassified Streptomyces TaxID=2593676 RepID=UPI00386741C1|nr:SHOCT domain-containing protein [Streptomyces sp. NBC_01102]